MKSVTKEQFLRLAEKCYDERLGLCLVSDENIVKPFMEQIPNMVKNRMAWVSR